MLNTYPSRVDMLIQLVNVIIMIHLVNMPEIRIKKYSKGWVVERQFKTWYGKKYWKHIISVSGINSKPWYYSTKDNAVNEAKKNFGWDLYYGNAIHA